RAVWAFGSGARSSEYRGRRHAGAHRRLRRAPAHWRFLLLSGHGYGSARAVYRNLAAPVSGLELSRLQLLVGVVSWAPARRGWLRDPGLHRADLVISSDDERPESGPAGRGRRPDG